MPQRDIVYVPHTVNVAVAKEDAARSSKNIMKQFQVARFGPILCHKRSHQLQEASGMSPGPKNDKKKQKNEKMPVGPGASMTQGPGSLEAGRRPTIPVRQYVVPLQYGGSWSQPKD